MAVAACSGSNSVSSNDPPTYAVSANIGPAGGTLETTDAEGTQYNIGIPAGVLTDTIKITITGYGLVHGDMGRRQ